MGVVGGFERLEVMVELLIVGRYQLEMVEC